MAAAAEGGVDIDAVGFQVEGFEALRQKGRYVINFLFHRDFVVVSVYVAMTPFSRCKITVFWRKFTCQNSKIFWREGKKLSTSRQTLAIRDFVVLSAVCICKF